MNLKQLLRYDFTTFVKPHFEENKCEMCGCEKDGLHVHHMIFFQKLLDETLKQLHLKYYENVDDYSEDELQLIRDVMLSKQMRIEYITCCEPCHLKLHEGSYHPTKKPKQKLFTKGKKNIYGHTHDTLDQLIKELDYLVSLCEKNPYSFLNGTGKQKIIEVCNLYENPYNSHTKIVNLKKLNKKMKELGLKYEIITIFTDRTIENIRVTTIHKIVKREE